MAPSFRLTSIVSVVGRRLACLALVLALPPGEAAGEWRRIESENFTAIGEVSERRLRTVVQRLEQFRDALTQVLSRARVTSTVPTVVFVFPNRRAHEPYLSVFNGKPVEAAGWFAPGLDVNYITMNLEHEQFAYRTICHEYAHHIIDNTLRWVPQWFNEGMAEYYRSFELTDGGRKAYVGSAHPEHVLLLRQQKMLPLDALFEVTIESPLYNEGDQRGVFYAQSWALVHYLMYGNPTRKQQLFAFLDRVATGEPTDRVFREVFEAEPGVLQKELERYVQRWAFMVTQVTFPERIATSRPLVAATMPAADAEAELTSVQVRIGRVDLAKERLEKLLASPDPGGRTLLAHGRLLLQEGRHDEAVAILERAGAALPDDFLTHYSLGLARTRVLEARGEVEPGDAMLAAAHAALTRALDLRPDSPEALAQLGRLEGFERATLASARARLERAVAQAPTRPHYKLMLARVLIELAEHKTATDLLGPLVATDRDRAIRDHARFLLSELATAANAPPGRPRPSLAAADGPVPPPQRRGPRFIPVLRDLAAGEQRAEAYFLAIECGTPQSIVARFERIDRPAAMALAVSDLAAVEFIAYREDLTGAVTCGPRERRERVLVTWVEPQPPAADTAGRLVAVEFIPDDYVVR